MVYLILLIDGSDTSIFRHAFLYEILKIGESKMSKLRLWMHLCVIVLVIENIHHHVLLQVLLEILIIKLNLLLKGFDHHILEVSFLVALINVNEALIVLLQRIHVCHLHILNILGVMLQLVLALLLL
jgi:hypothetical protein